MYIPSLWFCALFYTYRVLALDSYYTIFPKSNTDTTENGRITADIYQRVDQHLVHLSQSPTLGTFYWYAPLNAENIAHFRGDTGVRAVVLSGSHTPPSTPPEKPPGSPTRTLRSRTIVSQIPAPSSLRMITKADGQTEYPDGYYYDDSAGTGIRIYIVDSGLAPEHQEFAGIDTTWRWAGPFGPTDYADDTGLYGGHGTCMVSCALGVKDGVAKKSKLAMIRASRSLHNGVDVAIERWIDALGQVYDEILNNNEQGKAVVSMSWGFTPPSNADYTNAAHDTFAMLLKAIINDLDVPALAAAGNLADLDNEIIVIPAILGEKDVPELIVIGAVDFDGIFVGWTQKSDWLQLFAPGDDVECAKPDGTYTLESGTSPATALAAGVVAYYMGMGQSTTDARAHLYASAHPHRDRGVKVIWNDVDTRTLSAPQAPAPADPPAVPAPPAPPYSEGICSFHLTQRRSGPIARFGVPIFTVEVTIHDNYGAEIGHIDEQNASQGIGMTSKLEWILTIKDKGKTGGIDFAYGDQSWDDGAHGDNLPTCKRGGWDVTDGGDKANRQMDCNFSCKH